MTDISDGPLTRYQLLRLVGRKVVLGVNGGRGPIKEGVVRAATPSGGLIVQVGKNLERWRIREADRAIVNDVPGDAPDVIH